MADKVMKAVKFEAENTMRLKAVSMDFDPNQNVYVIAGDNAQGKSSALNVIMMLLGGRRLDPPRVIREGEEEAQAELTLDDGYVVKCRWKLGHPGKLEVLNPAGMPIKSPQKWLEEKVGRYSFDPGAFLMLKGDDQVAEVCRALGLDFSMLDTEYADKFSERTLVGREFERAKARLSALPKPKDDEQPIDMKTLLGEQEGLIKQQQERLSAISSANEAKAKLDGVVSEYKTVESALKRTDAELEAALQAVERLKQTAEAQQLQLVGLKDRGEKAREAHRQATVLAEKCPNVDMQLTMLSAKLEEAQAQTVAAAKAKEREQVEAEFKQKEAEYEALTKRLTTIETQKAKLLSDAKFPVPGLSFTKGGLKLNDIPFEQASQAERLRVSVALGVISRPELRILLVREGSLFDGKSLAMLAQVAAEYDAQVLLEVVGKDRKGPCIVIEDGEVAEVRS